ncbi:hypothetical protein J3Q64DRAFT_1747648 [Phycomyces blakesleeanus]|uniref:F-box domain-containing protein n=1 Tax=Phycomyces blakesleeanus TaxID=4837 RepID=A0ABR3AXS0_PHYBL
MQEMENPISRNSHLVQALRFTGYCTIDWLQSDTFRTFPNLKHLDIQYVYSKYSSMNFPSSYPPLDSLVSIKLQIHAVVQEIPTKDLLDLLKTMPRLRKLDVCVYSSVYSFRITPSNLNTLHEYLPHLTSITLRLALADISQDSVQTDLNITPILSVTTLDLDILDWDHLWLYYLSYKYPNVHTLRWKTSCASSGWIVKGYKELKGSPLRSIKAAFPHLDTFDFYTEDRTAWSHAILWELLCPSKAPIKKLKYTIKKCSCSAIYTEKIIQRLVQSFSKTIKTLSIVGDVYFDTENIARPEFSYCPRLVELEITDCGVSIALDNLLDNCISLRRLCFHNGRLFIGPEIHGELIKHGLQSLKLDSVVASGPVFDYLSFRCRSLEFMDLARAQICGSVSDKTKRLYIDMSYTSFKVLRLDHIQLYSSDKLMDKSTAINFLSLSQSTGPRLSGKRQQIQNDGPAVGHPTWFHKNKKF